MDPEQRGRDWPISFRVFFIKYFIPSLAWKIFKSNDICSHIQSLLHVEFDINGPLISEKMSLLKCQRSIMAFVVKL